MILRKATIDVLEEWLADTDGFLETMLENLERRVASGEATTFAVYEELLEERWLVQEDLNKCAEGKAIVTSMKFGSDPNVTEIL